MKRSTALKIISPVIAVMLVIQVFSGLFSDSLSSSAFEIFHEINGLTLAGLIVLHVVLNWNWIKSSFFKKTIHA